MPLKASIGISRKVGQENYSSRGAHCQLEVELDASLVQDAEAFHEQIRRLYVLANQAVNDQLEAARAPAGPANPAGANDEPATNKQVKLILDLARRRNLTLAQTQAFCRQVVGVEDVYQLTKRQASQLIDSLNGKSAQERR